MKKLSNADVLKKTELLAAEERKITADLLIHLREVERRRLHAELGYGSLFEFTVKHLKFSEGAASRRIAAMRLLRDCVAFRRPVELWHSRKYPEKLGASIHRYADDIVIVCRKNGKVALGAFVSIMNRLGLTVNQEKTKITDIKDGFDFIGFEFVKRPSPSHGKNVIYIFPSRSSEKSIRVRIKGITKRRAPIKPNEFIRNMNLVVGGWGNYYRHTNAAQTLRRLQRFINNRTRRYLQYRRKGRGFGFWRYPEEKLYEMGLIQIHSGWVKHEEHPAHAPR